MLKRKRTPRKSSIRPGKGSKYSPHAAPSVRPDVALVSRSKIPQLAAELLPRAQEVDEERDCCYTKVKRGNELSEELSFQEGSLRKILEAMAAMRKRWLGRRQLRLKAEAT